MPGCPGIPQIMKEKTSGDASSFFRVMPCLRASREHAMKALAPFRLRPSVIGSRPRGLAPRSRIADDLHYIHGWKSEKGALL